MAKIAINNNLGPARIKSGMGPSKSGATQPGNKSTGSVLSSGAMGPGREQNLGHGASSGSVRGGASAPERPSRGKTGYGSRSNAPSLRGGNGRSK